MPNNQGPKQKKPKLEFPQAKMGKDTKKKVTDYVESYIAKKVEQYMDGNDVKDIKDIPKKVLLNPVIEVSDNYGIKIRKNGQPCPEDVDEYLKKKGGSEAVSREQFVQKWANLVVNHIENEEKKAEEEEDDMAELSRSKGIKKLKVSKSCNEVPKKKTKSKSKSRSASARKVKRSTKPVVKKNKTKTKSKTKSKSSSGKPKKVKKVSKK